MRIKEKESIDELISLSKNEFNQGHYETFTSPEALIKDLND